MAEELKQFSYEHKDLLRLMLRDKNIHEGHWIIMAELKFAAMNVIEDGVGLDQKPAGTVLIDKIGMQRIPDQAPGSVDAAIVNPV